eukprot:2228817-Heterocapsa_arctica.AAC.1
MEGENREVGGTKRLITSSGKGMVPALQTWGPQGRTPRPMAGTQRSKQEGRGNEREGGARGDRVQGRQPLPAAGSQPG